MVRTGLDRLVSTGFASLAGRSLGVLCNQASIDSNIDHILDHMEPLHRSGFLRVKAVFGPQHGLFGHTQDNMIEWEGKADERRGWPVHSLYGEHRDPTDEVLDDVDLLLIDLPDVGSRYYTFIWTTALCMRACGRLGIPVLVLDRPNPIGGSRVEGTVLSPEFASFVGLHPLPMRHGMTLGELARYLQSEFYTRCELRVEAMEGWDRQMGFADTGLPWAMPSPNMPTVDTALVYPGGCLLEATNLSDGRGTTRPFEIAGAPWLDGHRFCEALNQTGLPGVKFRPIQFEPTFNKYAGEICEGCFIHVLDREAFEPAITAVALMQEGMRQSPDFAWNPPPYEYELQKLPVDVLAGNSWLRGEVESGTPVARVRQRFAEECADFASTRRKFLGYPLPTAR